MSTLYRRPNGYNLSWYCAPGCPNHPPGKAQHCVSLRTKDGEKARQLQKDHDRALSSDKAKAALGLQLPVSLTASWSLQQFIDRYESKVTAEQLVKPNTWDRTERWALQSLLTFRPQAQLSDLTTDWVRDYQGMMKSRVAPATWNSRRATLRAIFNRAVRWQWVSVNPFLEIDRAKTPRTKPKRLYQEQLPLVLAKLTRFWQLVTLFLYSTGCRRHELCDLKRTAVRWKDGYFEIEQNKENRPKVLALTPELKQIIHEAEGLCKSPYVFSLTGAQLSFEAVKSAYARVSRQVGFPVSAHRFRHSHGTHVLDAGGNLKSIQSTLGHANIQTTAHYYLDVDLPAQRRSMGLLPVESLLTIPPKPRPIVAVTGKALK